MPRQNKSVESLLLQGKIRKRGCSSSPSSSTSLVLRDGYRFKRAIVVGKRGGSTTPVPKWRLTRRSPSPASALGASAAAVDGGRAASARYAPSQCGSKSAAPAALPVSARKLAATLWEMNEIPSPRVGEEMEEKKTMTSATRRKTKTERVVPTPPPPRSLPPHLFDPSHSPVSERMESSGTGSRQRRASSISRKFRLADRSIGAVDSISSVSFMDIEMRSRVETPTGSTAGVRPRLKDVSSALTTSKELLKIINRMWGQVERPSSSMSLISALHAELERARLQVNQLIQEQRSDNKDLAYLMKCFAKEKAAWENKDQEAVEAAIESVAGDLEVERKLRRRFESLNKKLGKELSETKLALMKAVKEMENERRARIRIEKMLDELARNISKDKAEVKELKMESLKAQEEVEKEREMMQLADALREERVHMKLLEAKHQLEEKNAAVDKLKSRLQAFLRTKRFEDKTRGPPSHVKEEEIAEFLNNARFSLCHNSDNNEDGEVEDGEEFREDSGESDLHSIELNMDNSNKSYKWVYPLGTNKPAATRSDEDEYRARRSTSNRAPRQSKYLQCSISDGIDWVVQSQKLQKAVGLQWEVKPKAYLDETYAYRSNKGPKDNHQFLSDSRISNIRGYGSPTRERPPDVTAAVSKSRLSTRNER